MKITFDPPKRHANLDRRGLDFADLTIGFFEGALIVSAKNGRYMAIGEFEDEIISVVFARLGSEALSVVSMRRASRKERNAYAERQTED